MSRREAEALASQAGSVLAHYNELVAKYGDDPGYDGAVIRFKKSYATDLSELFGDGIRTVDIGVSTINVAEYWYVAIRSAGRWFLSGGKAPQRIDWEQFLDFLESGVPVNELERMLPERSHSAGVDHMELKSQTQPVSPSRRPRTSTTRLPSQVAKSKKGS
jgi:hypothetical protein